jgi:protein-disulfide isomerase
VQSKKEKNMTWTILVLLIAIALFIFDGALIKHNPKKQKTMAQHIVKKCIKLLALILLIGGITRLYVPYYLTDVNPGIVKEMVEGMQKQEQNGTSKEIKKYVRKHMDEMIANAPVLGNVEAKKTIFVFTDGSCPYCRRVHSEIMNVLKDEKDVRVVIKNFSIHGVLSDGMAQATIAAKLQDNAKAASLYDNLMTKQYWPNDLKGNDQDAIAKAIDKNIMEAAKKVGLDTERLAKDMNGEVVQKEMDNVRELTQKFNITGTPFLIIGDQAFPGAIPAAQIKQALK